MVIMWDDDEWSSILASMGNALNIVGFTALAVNFVGISQYFISLIVVFLTTLR